MQTSLAAQLHVIDANITATTQTLLLHGIAMACCLHAQMQVLTRSLHSTRMLTC